MEMSDKVLGSLKCFIPLIIGIIIGEIFYVIRKLIDFYFIFGTIGLIITISFLIYRFSAKENKKRAKYFSFISMFIFMISAVFIFNENFQIEHFIMSILTLTYLGAVTHWTVAKVIGPIFYGRMFCGWGCWTAAAFELLPLKNGNKKQFKFRFLRYISLAVAIVITFVAVFYFKYRPTINLKGNDQIIWFVTGSLIYCISGIILMYKLNDRRAFCKYLCPAALIQKVLSRYSLVKITGDKSKCTNCKLCEKKCPMDIEITKYISNNRRVLNTECILCNECATNCPKQILKISVKIDK